MPSRREVLTASGGVAVTVAGGAGAFVKSVGSGTVYHKNVAVTREQDGQRWRFDVLDLMLSGFSSTVYGEFVSRYADAFEPPATLQVDADLHETLAAEFKQVDYFITFAKNGRLSGRVSRSDFNQVGVGDAAQVLAYDWLDVDAFNHVLSVTDQPLEVSRKRIRTYSFEQLPPDG